MKTKPLGNNVLVEVLAMSNASSVSTANKDNEVQNYGILRSFSIDLFHLTASAGLKLEKIDVAIKQGWLEKLVGKVVRWEQYAEGGQTFIEDGKTYAIIPWWRLIGYEE